MTQSFRCFVGISNPNTHQRLQWTGWNNNVLLSRQTSPGGPAGSRRKVLVLVVVVSGARNHWYMDMCHIHQTGCGTWAMCVTWSRQTCNNRKWRFVTDEQNSLAKHSFNFNAPSVTSSFRFISSRHVQGI